MPMSEEPPAAELSPAIREQLRAHLEDLAHLIDHVREHASRSVPALIPAILAQHRAEFYCAMDAVGRWIGDFVAKGPSPAEIRAAREHIAAPIIAWSGTSPIFQYSLRRARGHQNDFEVIEHVFQNRPAGADIAALVFNDYYQHTVAAQALRNRLGLLTRRLSWAAGQWTRRMASPVRILSLQSTPSFELLRLADAPEFADVQVTCLGVNSAAIRLARRKLSEPLGQRIHFLRADPLRLDRAVMRTAAPYHVIYTVSLADLNDERQVARLIGDCYPLLHPEGVLISAYRSDRLPWAERNLGEWLYGLRAHYRDEAEISHIFAQTPFGTDRLEFERELLGVDLLATSERA